MPVTYYLPSTIGLIWAGLSLGGALIAAPAKFQAPNLTMNVALEVGRAQFQWNGVAEIVLLAALVISFLWTGGRGWMLFAIPMVIFIVQRFVIMPPLDARTLLIISDKAVEQNYLHIFYIAFEVLKFLSLIGASIIALQAR